MLNDFEPTSRVRLFGEHKTACNKMIVAQSALNGHTKKKYRSATSLGHFPRSNVDIQLLRK